MKRIATLLPLLITLNAFAHKHTDTINSGRLKSSAIDVLTASSVVNPIVNSHTKSHALWSSFFIPRTSFFVPRPSFFTPRPPSLPTDSTWFPYFDFNPATFQSAPRQFGPFTRWWLPGNDITSEELQREIKMFADNGFAGVEVQPLTMGLNPKAPQDQHDRIYSWDTPSFYEHLQAIMQQGQASGVTVDMNGGSGWPLGGSFFDPKESMKTLAVSDTILQGGAVFNEALPAPGNHTPHPQGAMAGMMRKNFVDVNWASVKSVIAAKSVIAGNAIKTIYTKTVVLDASSLINLTDQIRAGENSSNGKNHTPTLHWQAPAGAEWRLIISWAIPSGEMPSLVASPKTNYVIDHLDPTVVNKAYDYLLGDRTGLPAYYHKPLRAVFNDSYEFHTDRIISPDFLEVFKAQNGYDVSPYLSSVFQKGYDHPTYLAAMYAGAKPPFSFSETDNWRIMYDYDRTVNEVFKNNFIKTSDAWMQKRGLLHRTQAYGFPADIIGNSGAADIPEAEQLFAEGSEGYLKLVTSGAHLYGKPVVTQESFVSIYRAEMTTPQKIKMWADKSFACGVNQLIYHGTPYKYNNGEYGKEGWNTWSGPYQPFVNFSNGMNESDPFWKDIKQVNQYLTRCQYALRAGKPKTDVLIYMPFVDFTEDQMSLNPEEILYRGYFKGVEPDIKGQGVFEAPHTAINIWYSKLWKIVNELESRGITWEFVNDEALQLAQTQSGKITIAGNEYQSLILANLPYINLATAKHINDLGKQGMHLCHIGTLPQKQPSWLNHEANDPLAQRWMVEASHQKNAISLSVESDLTKLKSQISNLKSNRIHFVVTNGFSRQITREMADGSQLRFLWNKSDQWQLITLSLDAGFLTSYWLDPQNGSILKNKNNVVFYHLPPYGSIILLASVSDASTSVLTSSVAEAVPSFLSNTLPFLSLESWTLKVGDKIIPNTALFNWQKNDQLKYSSEDGIYTTSIQLTQPIDKKARYILDLGTVYFTASVLINGQEAGKRLFAPYQLDISQYLKKGGNTIEVRTTTTRRNGFIGEAVKGNPLYSQFKGKEQTTVPTGLIGPVTIKKVSTLHHS